MVYSIMPALEKNTNQLYRQKYFVDSTKVLRYKPPPAAPGQITGSDVISKRRLCVSDVRVPMNKPAPPPETPIAVQVSRDGNTIKEIRIKCPCGRHAELDLHYDGGQAGGHRAPGQGGRA